MAAVITPDVALAALAQVAGVGVLHDQLHQRLAAIGLTRWLTQGARQFPGSICISGVSIRKRWSMPRDSASCKVFMVSSR